MKAQLKVCRKCRYLIKKRRYHSSDIVDLKFHDHFHITFMCLIDGCTKIGSTNPDDGVVISKGFKVPDGCPYRLEHVMTKEK